MFSFLRLFNNDWQRASQQGHHAMFLPKKKITRKIHALHYYVNSLMFYKICDYLFLLKFSALFFLIMFLSLSVLGKRVAMRNYFLQQKKKKSLMIKNHKVRTFR